ncbi:SNF1-related protein kinase regulatory subunit beta-1 [Iris pallida]|uniref:SNF1-related protein kinase regulatory subunit beta-1 n=1 Tax=Iris pallida TaxID=29817 RepID=A0AAX6E1B8_IRIPA|nr:SNF1-related protein kinase regulatory subunit beta-1 [Iris pallida]
MPVPLAVINPKLSCHSHSAPPRSSRRSGRFRK